MIADAVVLRESSSVDASTEPFLSMNLARVKFGRFSSASLPTKKS